MGGSRKRSVYEADAMRLVSCRLQEPNDLFCSETSAARAILVTFVAHNPC